MRANGHVYDTCWQVDDVDLEEIVLAYLGLGTPRRPSARGGRLVIWLTWRQQRTETLIAAVLLARARGGADPDRPARRAPSTTRRGSAPASRVTAAPAPTCCRRSTAASTRLLGLVGWFTLLPAILAILLAAPFAIELEQGTFRLAWTQSITRRRWLTSKLGLIVAGALVAALIMSAAADLVADPVRPRRRALR